MSSGAMVEGGEAANLVEALDNLNRQLSSSSASRDRAALRLVSFAVLIYGFRH